MDLGGTGVTQPQRDVAGHLETAVRRMAHRAVGTVVRVVARKGKRLLERTAAGPRILAVRRADVADMGIG